MDDIFGTRRTEPLQAELHWLADLLGAVRDTDVLRTRIDRMLYDLPDEQVVGPIRSQIRERLAADEARARKALSTALDSDRYATIQRDLETVIAAAHPHATARRMRRRARKALRRADAMLGRAAAPG
jgi:CHAD domain-containing protein